MNGVGFLRAESVVDVLTLTSTETLVYIFRSVKRGVTTLKSDEPFVFENYLNGLAFVRLIRLIRYGFCGLRFFVNHRAKRA